ncbi:E3 ubiquitin-protein ligase RNF213 [Exaiptasia diaphana]|nr:E3 ubiquitin-protein ligase RNF213 [Exaiptasia diaphana]
MDNIPSDCSANNIDEDIRPLQLRRRWESSAHPYIFFNQDRITMTFLGFHVQSNGSLIDPDTGIVIEEELMTKQLQNGLAHQKVDFNPNYNSWTKFSALFACLLPSTISQSNEYNSKQIPK